MRLRIVLTYSLELFHVAIAPPPSTPSPTPASPPRTLSELQPLEIAVVVELDAVEDDVLRLKHLGICSGRRVQLVKAGDPLILRVLGSRIGLSARLAELVKVESCHVVCE